ncbi:hypothetical protein F4554_003731 [Actinopolymorpha rutila]|uniref:DUF3592 domain-containing protein n=1 Tax=Actinopolymorpha rutila TaxID=446787 RepID=A0A852ZFJ3_9ACTN|nr:hypothetical protein [Actinopolymorpha rutila]
MESGGQRGLLSILAGLLGAAVLTLLAIGLAYDSHVLATRGQVADAVVLDKTLPKTSKEAARITVRFTTKDGHQVEDWTESFVDHDPSVHKGDTIQVIYDPDDLKRPGSRGGSALRPRAIQGHGVATSPIWLWTGPVLAVLIPELTDQRQLPAVSYRRLARTRARTSGDDPPDHQRVRRIRRTPPPTQPRKVRTSGVRRPSGESPYFSGDYPAFAAACGPRRWTVR